MPTSTILLGDCREELGGVASASVDLIVTSPPYANQRSSTYGGVKPDDYVEWFLPIADELQRVLKPSGTFILNIKECAVKGERHTYVLELILALRQRGWLWNRGICVAQEKLLPRQVAESVPRFLGAAVAVQQAAQIQDEPRSRDGSRGRLV